MTKVSRYIYLISSLLVLTGVAVQVFLAGMVVVAGQLGWADHRSLGHAIGLPLLAMVITAYVVKAPGSMKRLTWLLFVVYIVQADVVIFLRGSAPVLSAFHPVLALADILLAATLTQSAWSLVKEPSEPIMAEGGLDPAAAAASEGAD